MEDHTEFPQMQEPGGRGHALEATASMIWTLIFLAYSSSTFIGEFGEGWSAVWTVMFVIAPIALAGTPAILDKRPHALWTVVFYLLYILIPSFIQLLKPEDPEDIVYKISDLATTLIIWLPFELKLLSRDLSATGSVTVWPLLTASLNIINIFGVLRPLSKASGARGLGYTFKLNVWDVFVGVALAAAYTAMATMVATLLQFARFKRPTSLKPEREFAVFIGMFLSAVAEQLLFQGLIQNLLEQRLGPHSRLALLIASLVYGIAHVKRPKLGFEPPNYRYALFATITGFMTGLTWQLTGKVTAAAVTHALGDFVLWRGMLTKPTAL